MFFDTVVASAAAVIDAYASVTASAAVTVVDDVPNIATDVADADAFLMSFLLLFLLWQFILPPLREAFYHLMKYWEGDNKNKWKVGGNKNDMMTECHLAPLQHLLQWRE